MGAIDRLVTSGTFELDAAHSAEPIVEAVAGRNVVAVVLLHPADHVLWRMTHPEENFRGLEDGLLVRPRPRCGVQRRHPLKWWPASRDRNHRRERTFRKKFLLVDHRE